MKIAPSNDFTKSYGTIDTTLRPGMYSITIENLWDSTSFSGQKYFQLIKTTPFGGENKFMGFCYLIIGIFSLILSILSVVRKYQRPNGILYHKINKIILYSESKLALNY